jgi:hypothetical protein
MEAIFVDDIDSRDFDTQDFGTEELDPMIVYGDTSAITRDNDKPIPFDDSETPSTNISHSPLSLGGDVAETLEPKPASRPPQTTVSADRITGIRTFFTKLHPGAIEFLDQQITNWLKANPGLSVKRTNVATGEVQGKKTETNIIITVWY